MEPTALLDAIAWPVVVLLLGGGALLFFARPIRRLIDRVRRAKLPKGTELWLDEVQVRGKLAVADQERKQLTDGAGMVETKMQRAEIERLRASLQEQEDAAFDAQRKHHKAGLESAKLGIEVTGVEHTLHTLAVQLLTAIDPAKNWAEVGLRGLATELVRRGLDPVLLEAPTLIEVYRSLSREHRGTEEDMEHFLNALKPIALYIVSELDSRFESVEEPAPAQH